VDKKWVEYLKTQLSIYAHLTKYVWPIKTPIHPFTQLFYVCKWLKYLTTCKIIKYIHKNDKNTPK
jgi:hypothetical protein